LHERSRTWTVLRFLASVTENKAVIACQTGRHKPIADGVSAGKVLGDKGFSIQFWSVWIGGTPFAVTFSRCSGCRMAAARRS
jgi:hypothetical protein